MNFDFGDMFKNLNIFSNKTNNVNNIKINNDDNESGKSEAKNMYGIPMQDDDVQFKPDDGNKKYGIPMLKYAVPEQLDEPENEDPVKPGLAKYAMPNIEKYAIYKPEQEVIQYDNPDVLAKYAVPNINVEKYAIYKPEPENTEPEVIQHDTPNVNVEKYAIYRPNSEPVNQNPVNNRWGWNFYRPSSNSTFSNPFNFSLSNMFGRIFGNLNNILTRFFGR